MTLTESMGRGDLAAYFADRCFSRGAEIGVEQGEYSDMLCRANPSLRLLCVDAWQAYKGYREHVTQAKLDGFYEATKARLARYRVDILRLFSVPAAATVPDRSLDFVYLDANHVREHVEADIAAWAPKVRAGGILAGHDYCRRKRMDYGVIEAVQTYATARQLTPLILRGDKSPSWVLVQP